MEFEECEWVSVDDDMPDEFEWVLVTNDSPPYPISVAQYNGKEWSFLGQIIYTIYGQQHGAYISNLTFNGISSWTPLPNTFNSSR
jgi:hypothetical protein